MDITTRAKQIKLVLTDVDGVLTDGRMHYAATGEQLKTFHVHDGLGIRRLLDYNIQVGVLTGRTSEMVTIRMRELAVPFVYQGLQDKKTAFITLLEQLALPATQVAYIGDDINDLCVLQQVGLSATVPAAPALVKQQVHWCTNTPGGYGAFRELAELILTSQNLA